MRMARGQARSITRSALTRCDTMPSTLMRSSRRAFLTSGGAAAVALAVPRWLDAAPRLRVTGLELLPVRATERTVWLIVRLRTDAGLTGLGEASDAFGFANTTKADAARMESELRGLFELVNGQSPLEIERYRQRGLALASKGLVQATAFSAIEQALWDLSGKALDLPVSALFGGAVRDRLTVYANINRATTPRTPEGFAASARSAVRDGFRAIKGAPWDGFPPAGSPPALIEAAVQAGIDAARAMREAVKHCGGLLELTRRSVRKADRLTSAGFAARYASRRDGRCRRRGSGTAQSERPRVHCGLGAGVRRAPKHPAARVAMGRSRLAANC